MAHEHVSGIAMAYDRDVGQQRQAVVFVGDRLLQGADLNGLQTIIRERDLRVGRMVAKDGDRITGGEALVDVDAETVLLADGTIFAGGDTLPVASALLMNVPMTGRVNVGVKMARQWLTHETNPELLGIAPGTEAEGEAGTGREVATLAWALETDTQSGDFIQVYVLLDGTIIDQQPPPVLTGVQQTVARYDFDANGHYVVDGCEVSAIGKTVDSWIFSIAAGTANVQGFKRIRETAYRLLVEEEADLEDVIAETHNYATAAGGAMTVNVNRAPISSLTSAVVIKRVTQNVVRGAVPNTADDLTFNSATEIESVVVGVTTYTPTTDYVLSGGKLSWAPGGAEPAAGSTMAVTYLYAAQVAPTSVDETSVTVTGGVQGKPITLRYLSKLPRIDLICMELSGAPRYVKGVSAREYALPPIEPVSLLKLAEVHNNWLTNPVVVNNGVRNYTYAQQRRLFNRLIDVLEQFDRQTAQLKILEASPVAKKGIFTDTFVDDFYRDQGLSQTAAINQGVLQLAIDPTMLLRVGVNSHVLPYTERLLLSQPQRTRAMRINPYANFVAMPAGMTIEPAADFWTETNTIFLSDVTREFTTAPGQPPGQTVINEVTEIRRDDNAMLRQIEISVSLEGFAANENLATLVFDGINVKPAGTQTADINGDLTVAFTIPANVPEGIKRVRATGAAGSFAEARFVGDGTIDIAVMRRVTLVAREAAPPVINVITNITNVTNVTVNQITQQVVRNNDNDDNDPLAQTFMVTEPCMVVGVNFWIEVIGDPSNGIRVQLATVSNGYPTANVMAEDFVPMTSAVVGQKMQARFGLPVFMQPGIEYCFVILTDDAEHAVSIAQLGDIVDLGGGLQSRVSSQPYTTGVMFSSANRLTWTPHQDADISFELIAADFTDDDVTVVLWTGALNQISDLNVRGAVELPNEETVFHYELVRASGDVVRMLPGQNLEFSEYVDETVTIRAVLKGTASLSPVLYPGTLIAGGKMRSTGTYVTRNFDFGSAVEATAIFAANTPAGSTVVPDVRVNADAFQSMTLDSTGTLGGGWVEPKYKRASITGAVGQVRLTLTGTPAARPRAALLRAFTI